jgi:hypothetical protein
MKLRKNRRVGATETIGVSLDSGTKRKNADLTGEARATRLGNLPKGA